MTVTLTIRNVPEKTRDELASRAARAGQSMQEYVLARLEAVVERPDPADFWGEVEGRLAASGRHVPADDILAGVQDGRR